MLLGLPVAVMQTGGGFGKTIVERNDWQKISIGYPVLAQGSSINSVQSAALQTFQERQGKKQGKWSGR